MMSAVDRQRLHTLKETIHKSSKFVSLHGLAANGKYWAKTLDGKVVATFSAETADGIPEMQANAYVFAHAPTFVLLLSRIFEDAEKRLGEALAERDEAREALRQLQLRMQSIGEGE